MNDKEFAEAVHMELHAIRRIENYKSSPMDKRISKLVLNKFKDQCQECKEVYEKNKNLPEKESFLNKLTNFAK